MSWWTPQRGTDPAVRGLSYMRARVAPLTCHPAAGVYQDGPLRIEIRCATKNCQIMFTRDGAVPYFNSDREHRYRCEVYNPKTGIVVTERGVHVLTAVAHVPGLVDTPPTQFRFTVLQGGVRKQSRSDEAVASTLKRLFTLSADTRPSTSVSQARAKSPHAVLALKDATSHDELRVLLQSGQHVSLFELKAEGASSREPHFRRVATPSMSLTVPPSPVPPRGQSATSVAYREGGPPLRLDLIDASPPPPSRMPGAAGVYAPLPLADGATPRRPLSIMTASAADDGGGDAAARAATRDGRALSTNIRAASSASRGPSSRAVTPASVGSAMSYAKRVRTPVASASEAAQHSELAWFEYRFHKTIDAPRPDDDNEEAAADAAYLGTCKSDVEACVRKMEVSSPTFGRSYGVAAPVAPADIALASRRLVAALFNVQLIEASVWRRVVMLRVPTATLMLMLGKRSTISVLEFYRLIANEFSPGDLTEAMLRADVRLVATPDSRDVINVSVLCASMRYMVWHFRHTPEAVLWFGVSMLDSDGAFTTSSPPAHPTVHALTKLEAFTIIEAYRRTRGRDAKTAKLLTVRVQSLPWDERGECPLEAFVAMLRAAPAVDAVFGVMSDDGHAALRATLPPP